MALGRDFVPVLPFFPVTIIAPLPHTHLYIADTTAVYHDQPLERSYTRDWLPAYSFVVRARAMVLTGERTLSDKSGARKYCPRARQTAADNYVYGLSGVLKNRLQRAHQSTD
jgi:hypothetical protein